MADLSLALRVAVPLALLGSAGAVWWLDRPRGAWGRRVRSRLLLGVPWGTLVTLAVVLSVYLFVQDGLHDWYHPLVVPFSSWSYLYPLGVLTAPFAHASPSHLTGNLLGTVVLAPLAEYAWSHFPTGRGTSAFGSLRTNPYVRAFVLFPLGAVAVALGTSLFSWGPVIGFSGVVFAFAGFALVRYPLGLVVALAARSIVETAYYALRDPVVVGQASPSFNQPWWYGIAVQGHLLGFLLGVAVGVAVLGRRRERPSALRLWTGSLLFTSSLALWAIWWYRGPERYVLYRGLGVFVLVVLATLVALAVNTSDRPLFGRRGTDRSTAVATDGSSPPPGADSASPGGDSSSAAGALTRHQAATMLLLLPVLTMAFVAVPLNLTTVSAAHASPNASVQVRGYTVTYAEDVPNRKIPAFDVSIFGETTNVTTSGVIVVNRDRHIWTQEVSASELAFGGQRAVEVGGLGWKRTVVAHREGWVTDGGARTYQVWLKVEGRDWRPVFASPPANVSAVLAGKNVSIVPHDGRFTIAVTRHNESVGGGPVPQVNQTMTTAGIRFVRNESQLIATYNGTRVPIAHRESYE